MKPFPGSCLSPGKLSGVGTESGFQIHQAGLSISPLPKRVVLKKLRESEGKYTFPQLFCSGAKVHTQVRQHNTSLPLGPEKPLSV